MGDIERAWLTRSVVSNTLIHFDFYTFLADTRTTINIGTILLASVLYCYMRIFVLRSLYGVLVNLHTFTHYFSHLYWSVAGASWLIWLLCMDTVETTLSDQFFAFNSVNGSCKSIWKICRHNPVIIKQNYCLYFTFDLCYFTFLI